MSKQYFAKFLPVDGEIKEGDMFKISFTGLMKKAEKFDLEGIINCNSVGDKKYKLFLCSRDIQVSDEVRLQNKPEFTFYGEVLELLDDIVKIRIGIAGHRFHKKDEIFKVIGEISSGASWVKKGDQFEESDINKQLYDDSGSSDVEWFDVKEWVTYPGASEEEAGEIWLETKNEHKRIQIKCPTCKNFH